MKQKIFFLLIISSMVVMLTGCFTDGTTVYFKDEIPDLSFVNYQVTESEIKDSDQTVTGYKYTFTGKIINNGDEGNYIIDISGRQVGNTNMENVINYGPNYIKVETIPFSLEYSSQYRYDKFEFKLYAIGKSGDKKLQATVEYNVQ